VKGESADSTAVWGFVCGGGPNVSSGSDRAAAELVNGVVMGNGLGYHASGATFGGILGGSHG